MIDPYRERLCAACKAWAAAEFSDDSGDDEPIDPMEAIAAATAEAAGRARTLQLDYQF